MGAIGSQTLEVGSFGEDRDEGELEDLEKLEADVEEMARNILHYRTTLPDRLKETFITVLASQRPFLPVLESGSELGPADDPKAGTLFHF